MANTDTQSRSETSTSSGSSQQQRTRPPGRHSHSRLVTDAGNTSIADAVVARIAGLAAREIPGVHSMGKGMSRAVGQLRSMIPGGDTASRGVGVEVGEREAAIDLDLVTWYGQSIVDVTQSVRSNVMERVEDMTGLKVVEVNINVDDVYVEGEDDNDDSSESSSRVQ